MKLTDMSMEIQEEFRLENRVDYSQKLPCAEEIMEAYMKREQGKENKRWYVYRKTGKLALTWGWYMEELQKEKEDGVEDIDYEVLKISTNILKQYIDNCQETAQKMLRTLVFHLWVYPCMKNGGNLTLRWQGMLHRIYERFPWMLEAICGYSGVILRMQACRNIPYDICIFCLKKWEADGDKERDIGEFIRVGAFFKDELAMKEKNLKRFHKLLEFMEMYTAKSVLCQEAYAYQLTDRLLFHETMGALAGEPRDESKRNIKYIKEQFDKLHKKGIKPLECFFKYKSLENNWEYADLGKIKFFLTLQKDKTYALCAEDVDKCLEQAGKHAGEWLVVILKHCRIKMNKTKLYFFQVAIGLYTSEEEMVKYYKRKLLPKEILYKLMLRLRKEEKIDKLPLLLQWMYGEEKYD